MERKVFKEGIHNISNQDYHNSEGISRSMLMEFNKSPFHYDQKFNNPVLVIKEPGIALIRGELIHKMCLEPMETENRFIVQPRYDRRTKAGKLLHEQFLCQASDKTIIEYDLLQQCIDIALAVRDNALAQSIIQDARIEQSIYFTHEPTGLLCKVRPDIWNNTLVADLKSTANASLSHFSRSALQYGYFIQAGMIHEALKSLGIMLEKFIIIAVETEFPYPIAIYDLDEEAILWGITEYNALMIKLKQCMEKSSYPSYGYQTLFLPKFAQYYETGELENE